MNHTFDSESTGGHNKNRSHMEQFSAMLEKKGFEERTEDKKAVALPFE